MGKPRYWHVAYPLTVTALCVAPHQYFLKTWTACFEYSVGKLKVCIVRIAAAVIIENAASGQASPHFSDKWDREVNLDLPLPMSRTRLDEYS